MKKQPKPTKAPAKATKAAKQKAAAKATTAAAVKRNTAKFKEIEKAVKATKSKAPAKAAKPASKAPAKPAKVTPVTTPVTPEPVKLALSIFGANLPGNLQKQGQFHVHTTDCADCNKLRKMRPKFPEYKEHHATAESVAESIYADQIAEGCSLEAALADIYFAPCVKFPATPKAAAPAPVAPTPEPAPAPVVPEVPAVPVPAAPAPAKRYQSKTDPTSKYHNRDRSTVQKPVALVWGLCDNNPGVPRKDIIKMAVDLGVSPNTASTQYSFWKKARTEAAAKAGAQQLPLPGVVAK